jgi:hypothetical protein
MPEDLRPQRTWVWRCPRCHGTLVTLRDTCEGRRLLAILVHAAAATADELLQQGTLHHADLTRGIHWLCACHDA